MQKQKNWIFVVLAAGLVILAVMLLRGGETPVRPPELAYTDYKVLIAEGEIDAIKLEGEVATANLRRPLPLGPNGAVVEAFQTRIPAFGDPAFLKEIEARDVGLTIGEDKEKSVWSSALVYVLPWLLFIGVYVFLMRRMWSGMRDPFRGQAGKFLTAGSDKTLRKPPKVRFADVAGQDAAKREVKELVDFLREPERYTRLGAEVPHGILLMGPPGTGKTLLAKALAGEARVPFFSISASEFIEVFVGVGASRVRHMFEEAKKRAPSIIFIDEFDSIGRVRGAGFGGGMTSESRRSTRSWPSSTASRVVRQSSYSRRPTGPTCSIPHSSVRGALTVTLRSICPTKRRARQSLRFIPRRCPWPTTSIS